MIELVFLVCLVAGGDDCQERQILEAPEVGLMGCMSTGQARLAEWAGRHPEFRIERWKCGWVNVAEKTD